MSNPENPKAKKAKQYKKRDVFQGSLPAKYFKIF